jgi:hypothetical protein
MRSQGLTYQEASPELTDFSLHGAERLKAFGYRQLMKVYLLARAPHSALTVSAPSSDIYFLGHHKCATHWMRWFLFHLAPYIQFGYEVERGRRFANFRSWRPAPTIHLNVNADVTSLREVPEAARGFHLVRDPRDALVSEYFSRKLSHAVWSEWHVEMRTYLQSHSLEDGLIYLMDNHIYFMQLEGWELGSRRGILDVKYEELLANEYSEFSRILSHLGIELREAALRKIISRSSFERMTGGRKRGVEQATHHYRKGVAGDWENHMPPGGDVYQVFLERFGDLLVRLGYDT